MNQKELGFPEVTFGGISWLEDSIKKFGFDDV